MDSALLPLGGSSFPPVLVRDAGRIIVARWPASW